MRAHGAKLQKPGSFLAATPLTAENLCCVDTVRFEQFADIPRLSPPFIGEVALSGAIVHVKICRIASSRGKRMSHDGNGFASPELLPCISITVVLGRMGGMGKSN